VTVAGRLCLCAPMTKAPAKSPARKPAAKAAPKTVNTLNVNNPGKTYKRDAVKYAAARKAFLNVMPKTGPGVTQSEMMALMKKALPAATWGTTQGWWAKTVQLDAEARGEVIRDGGKPLRWKRVK
jgi:hypothetical protein